MCGDLVHASPKYETWRVARLSGTSHATQLALVPRSIRTLLTPVL
ncbi:MAG: hypothetical protein AVDCRST_MAG93-9096 [uncultured Chloroflexia bacterium]|uniref:Uncharacterized protein n=1 Tax=uncultured Chloroflexia bacterium TaxID=1672391 RepID=A0A6J4N7L4_9CHLR|nr:MAG: hypothetical protein AVDCRST_MAG93-9096 [uncultured Chloroflexia bacterium]